jgi:histidyl-tRNA synthetase
MRRFRHVERRFLEVTEAAGYAEIRTPTIEPLHLFTATGSLSPQLLDRVYSFLDWDGWSGERVVLRPDSTVPAARWYERSSEGGPARLSYVQPVYRFVPGDSEREQWQCGVELFGLGAPEADCELLLLARDFMAALGVDAPRFELSHAGLMHGVLAAAGLDAAEQIAAYDRLLDGDQSVTAELAAQHPAGAPALRLLFDVHGSTAGYLANLRAALLPVVPRAEAALGELELAANALDAAGCSYRFVPGTARNFEYYTGLTFRLLANHAECLAGGRYDGLAEAIGGRLVPACGFGADLLRLADIIDGGGR